MEMLSNSQVSDEAYQKHPVFETIDQMMDFYEGVSFSCFNFVPIGVLGISNYASYVFMSLKNSLDSIKMLLKAGHITDAFVLARKFFDTVLVEIYIDVVRKDKYDWMEGIIVKDANDWIKGKHRIPRIDKILSILKESKSTKELFPFFSWDIDLKAIRELLDDNVHVNRYDGLLLNCPQLCIPNRKKQLQILSRVLKHFFLIHMAFIFHLNAHYLMSSDYLAYLEMGDTPPIGSERWIAPYAQIAFDSFVKPHTKLAEFIMNSCGLDIA